MKFSIGDRVRFKRTGDEGVVASILDKNMVEVDLSGTIFPAFIDEIEHPYLKWFTEKSPAKKGTTALPEIRVEKPIERRPRLATGIHLSFLPVFQTRDMEEHAEQFRIYLLNELPLDVTFTYECKVRDEVVFSHTGALHSFGSVYLHHISADQMHEQPRFNWQITNESKPSGTKTAGKISASGVLRIKPVKLFEHINEILLGKESTFSYLLAEKLLPEDAGKWTSDGLPEVPLPQAPKFAASGHAPSHVVDLHIEKLVGSTGGLSNADIVHIQLRTLQRSIDAAISHRQEMLIVIHGLGKGTLREEVHKLLRKIPQIARFKNEWSARYGFGATEVWFRF
jgi:Smr domain